MAEGEFEFIASMLRPLAAGYPGAFELGDDTARVAVPPGEELVVKTDAIVCGVHFLPTHDPGLVARKALRVTRDQLTAEWAPDAPNPATMRVARAARELGVDAMVVPSAARDGGWNLAVLPHAFDRVRMTRRRREVPRPPADVSRAG